MSRRVMPGALISDGGGRRSVLVASSIGVPPWVWLRCRGPRLVTSRWWCRGEAPRRAWRADRPGSWGELAPSLDQAGDEREQQHQDHQRKGSAPRPLDEAVLGLAHVVEDLQRKRVH